MVSSRTASLSFESIEQLDEMTRALSWPTEYRQLEPGAFSSTVHVLEGDSWFLMEEESNCRVEVESGSPEGMYLFALAEGGPAVVNGLGVSENHLFISRPGSGFLASLPPGIKVTQMGVGADQVEHAIQSVAPGFKIPKPGAALFDIREGKLPSLRQFMRSALYSPSGREALRNEAASLVVAELLAVSADHGAVQSNRILNRESAQQAIDKAREYIEGHADEAIKVAPLCKYAGTNIRSLERAFSRELGVSPQQYMRARRFNAVRRELLVADGDTNVATVAKTYGFVHLGRFAGEYHRYFGEYPSETLRNR